MRSLPPDLAALADCVGDLDPAARPGPLADQVGLSFEATPDAASIATPETMRACWTAPTDRPLHVGRLLATTGFFAQVPTVFVAFDDAGRVERAYIPGILDADLGGEASGPVMMSQAADGNVPDAANAVTGCIGAYEVTECLGEDGRGHYHMSSCAAPLSIGTVPATGPLAFLGGDTADLPGGGGGRRFGGGGGGGSSGGSTGGGDSIAPLVPPDGNPPDDGDPTTPLNPPDGGVDLPDPVPPFLSPVPLPSSGLLLLVALGGLAASRVMRGSRDPKFAFTPPRGKLGLNVSWTSSGAVSALPAAGVLRLP